MGRLTTTNRDQRFLQEVLVDYDAQFLKGDCSKCGNEGGETSTCIPYSEGGGGNSVDHYFNYRPTGTVTNVKATVFGGCQGLSRSTVSLNGIAIGTIDPDKTVNSCSCNSCFNFDVESSNSELIESIRQGENEVSFKLGRGPVACLFHITLDFTVDDDTPSSGGDPHITTWKNEHFEYHGQCDLSLVKDAEFADGLGLDVQIRTKIVRYWSYIKNIAIKIDSDILEIEGSAGADDAEAHYWVNYEFQGDFETFAGFPVTQELPSVYKRKYIIDLGSKYPGSSIVIQLYKEFVRVKFVGDEEVFGNTVGLMGDYKTGELIARDGSTVMTDFTEFGDEWQVLPREPKLFHEFTHPQFPELCIKPEDPRGESKRRLAESTVSIEQAEAACEPLKDPLSIKDCVYDILATQDLDMVGAF